VAEFIGASTVLRGRAAGADRLELPGGEVLRVDGGAAFRPGEAVDVGIRPERIRVVTGAGENVVDGHIAAVVYQGVQTEVIADLAGGQRLLVFVAEPSPTPLAPGQPLRLHLPADAFIRLAAPPG
jgi:putative spermidine/putrescine transport system ATP-binding protein